MIDKILQSIEHIPVIPSIMFKVSEMLKDEDYSVNDLTEMIKCDPAIAANVLKMCNSAYLAPHRQISNIREAVIQLGQENLVRVVQMAGVSRLFNNKVSGYASTGGQLWEHAVAVALMSQILARRILQHGDETLYLCALLHDVGKVVMGEYVQASIDGIMNMVAQRGCSFLEAEEEILGINHADLGGRIASYWNYPPIVQAALAHHHRPDLAEIEDDSFVWLVYLADQICLLTGITGGMDDLAHRGLSEVMQKFSFYEKDLEVSMIELLGDLNRTRDFIGILAG